MYRAAAGDYRVDRNLLSRLSDELKHAASRMDGKEWRSLIYSALARSARETCRSKYEGIKGLGRLGNEGWQMIRRDGIAGTGRELAEKAKEALHSLPERTRETLSRLSRLSAAELSEEVAPFVMGLVALYAASGGLDLEGGLPDTDLELGIGLHRNIFSHSVLIGFTTEGVLSFGVEILSGLYQKLPAEHHAVWDKVHRLIRNCEKSAITGLWVGICLHFIKDAGLLSHGTKPYTGLSGEHGMAFHQGLFAANGAASGVMGASQAASGKRF